MELYNSCCSNPSIFSIVYAVADKKIRYNVCNECIKLQCFNDYVLTKISVKVNEKSTVVRSRNPQRG